jgi:hypothetical protein
MAQDNVFVYNNIAISAAEYGKISKGYNAPLVSTAFVRPAYPTADIRFSTVLADNTHDHLSPLCLKSSMLEDDMLKNTKVLTDPSHRLITAIISEFGRCVEFKDVAATPQVFTTATDFEPTTAPYDIPNNNNQCFIRDCFDGTWIPGLNNIFDQAGASLKSFIEYHNGRSGGGVNVFKNPIKLLANGGSPGGIGQQLRATIGGDRLKYTAYFNYDLLWFKYILENYLIPTVLEPPQEQPQLLLTRVNSAIAGGDQLTPVDILVINTVNINFLWCRLMIYCYKCVDDDEFFSNSPAYRTGYLLILQKMTQIRFDGFATTGDDYISNPYIYYRGSGKTNILKGNYAPFLPYIESMCTRIYSLIAAPIPVPPLAPPVNLGSVENVTLAGGVEYVTSQSMAATCMSQFLKLIFPGRSKATGDAIKIACMNEINKLFNLTGNKLYPGYGWSILKFSGDSSHIVLGEIMEEIKKFPILETLLRQIEIIYAISERPLAARLLAAGKNVYSAVNSVFSKNFNGPGSANNSLRHAALYIQWDKTKQFVNLVQGLVDKVVDYTKITGNAYVPGWAAALQAADQAAADQAATTLQTDALRAAETAVSTNPAAYSAFQTALATTSPINNAIVNLITLNYYFHENPIFTDPLTDGGFANAPFVVDSNYLNIITNTNPPIVDNLIISFNALIDTDIVKTFLAAYSIVKLRVTLYTKITQAAPFTNLVRELGGGNRGAGHTNWLKVMKAFNMTASMPDAPAIRDEFDSMYEIVNLLVEYYIDRRGPEYPPPNPEYINRIFAVDNFQKIFKKILTAHQNKLLGGKNIEKIESFRQSREEEGRGDSKGNGDIIPGKVDSIIGRMETLLTNCFKIYDNLQSSVPNIMRGGVKTADNRFGKKYVNQPITQKRNIIQVLRAKEEAIAVKEEAIIAKEQIIDILTNGQFIVEMSNQIVITVNDINTKDKYDALITEYNTVPMGSEPDVIPVSNIDVDINKLESLKGESERLYSSLYPFMKSKYYSIAYNSYKSELSPDKIFANRLKNLDISDTSDFDILYKNEDMHLSAAVNYIKDILTNKPYVMNEEGITVPNKLSSAQIPIITQISKLENPLRLFPTEFNRRFSPSVTADTPHYNFTFGNVGHHLRSLSDIIIDSGITYKNTFGSNGPGYDGSLSLYFRNNVFTPKKLEWVNPIRVAILKALLMFFPNLHDMVPINEDGYYSNDDVFNVLYTLEQLSRQRGGVTLPRDATQDNILLILVDRQYVARLISTLGPQLEPLDAIREGVTRSTRWTRLLDYLKTTAGDADENDETTEAMTHLNTTVFSMLRLGGGKSSGRKTRRRRLTRSPNKTHRKTSQLHLQTSSTSHKSTRETINRKKTKRSNRTKKNKTRRKRNY